MKQFVRAAALTVAAVFGAPSFAQIQSASVTGGKVEGVVANGIASFKGIPFAAPASGDNRWRSPQPVKAWAGSKKADKYAPGCVQDPMMIRIFGGDTHFSEDCLYLNVWTPAKSASEKLPVMVWIYGGAFIGGQTSLPAYDGTHLAQKGVVLVSLSYRVGVFGFFAHPELGDQYELYQAGKLNDTPILIGTNSDEGALFTPPHVTPAMFEQQIRAGYGAKADAILAAYPHATDAAARTGAKNVFRETAFAWPTWAWARLQSQKGKHKAFVYYFDHRTPQSPEGANHGAEIAFVFRNQAPPFGAAPPEEVALADTISTYWTNFAKTGDPNGGGLPKWPAFTASSQQVMTFDNAPKVAPIPNLPQLQVFEDYYAWRRQQVQAK